MFALASLVAPGDLHHESPDYRPALDARDRKPNIGHLAFANDDCCFLIRKPPQRSTSSRTFIGVILSQPGASRNLAFDHGGGGINED
jgi:hypothetical protein